VRAVVQRVAEASVRVDDQVVGRIGAGLLILLGVALDDTSADGDYLADKILNMRVFPDEAGQMNLSVLDTRGELLAVSQFTLLADTRRGRRPGYSAAAPPEPANQLYRAFVERLRASGLRVEEGVFRAMMDVSLVNRGPVTILLDSKKVF
jgi:D-tyrosyl-tRNA(Tyr) deacylase